MWRLRLCFTGAIYMSNSVIIEIHSINKTWLFYWISVRQQRTTLMCKIATELCLFRLSHADFLSAIAVLSVTCRFFAFHDLLMSMTWTHVHSCNRDVLVYAWVALISHERSFVKRTIFWTALFILSVHIVWEIDTKNCRKTMKQMKAVTKPAEAMTRAWWITCYWSAENSLSSDCLYDLSLDRRI